VEEGEWRKGEEDRLKGIVSKRTCEITRSDATILLERNFLGVFIGMSGVGLSQRIERKERIRNIRDMCTNCGDNGLSQRREKSKERIRNIEEVYPNCVDDRLSPIIERNKERNMKVMYLNRGEMRELRNSRREKVRLHIRVREVFETNFSSNRERNKFIVQKLKALMLRQRQKSITLRQFNEMTNTRSQSFDNYHTCDSIHSKWSTTMSSNDEKNELSEPVTLNYQDQKRKFRYNSLIENYLSPPHLTTMIYSNSTGSSSSGSGSPSQSSSSDRSSKSQPPNNPPQQSSNSDNKFYHNNSRDSFGFSFQNSLNPYSNSYHHSSNPSGSNNGQTLLPSLNSYQFPKNINNPYSNNLVYNLNDNITPKKSSFVRFDPAKRVELPRLQICDLVSKEKPPPEGIGTSTRRSPPPLPNQYWEKDFTKGLPIIPIAQYPTQMPMPGFTVLSQQQQQPPPLHPSSRSGFGREPSITSPSPSPQISQTTDDSSNGKKRKCTDDIARPSKKKGVKHDRTSVDVYVMKAKEVNNFALTGLQDYNRYVVIHEEKFYEWVCSNVKDPKYKLVKASLLEKFDKSRRTNRVNPKDKEGKIPIKYLRIDKACRNGLDFSCNAQLEADLEEIERRYGGHNIRVYTHRDWGYLDEKYFIYEPSKKINPISGLSSKTKHYKFC
jgi:hypothetical protein